MMTTNSDNSYSNNNDSNRIDHEGDNHNDDSTAMTMTTLTTTTMSTTKAIAMSATSQRWSHPAHQLGTHGKCNMMTITTTRALATTTITLNTTIVFVVRSAIHNMHHSNCTHKIMTNTLLAMTVRDHYKKKKLKYILHGRFSARSSHRRALERSARTCHIMTPHA